MLTSTLPGTPAEAAVLARAKQLTDFVWTPCCDVPIYTDIEGLTVLPAGVPVQGFPYSSTEETDKFFVENVSFESFLTAIPNPHSTLYQPGRGAYGACNYGVVCNGLVRYALGIPYRVSTAKWLTIPGMRLLKKHGEYTVDDMRLCDVLFAYGEGRNHVAMITDILRNEDGAIEKIEISHATRPHCVRVTHTPEEFYDKWALFSLCRYDRLQEAPPLNEENDRLLWESGLENRTPAVTVDNGNRSNYLVGQRVLLSLLSDEEDTVELYRNGKKIEALTFSNERTVSLYPERGYYEARAKKSRESVFFCMNAATVRHEQRGDTVTVYADSNDEESTVLYMDFRVGGGRGATCAPLAAYEVLTEAEKESGVITRKIPSDGKNFKVYYKNPYGVWTHRMTALEEVSKSFEVESR